MTFDATGSAEAFTPAEMAPVTHTANVAPIPAPNPIKQETPAVSTHTAQAPVVSTPVIAAAKPSPAFAPTFPLSDEKRTEFLHHVASTIRTYAKANKSEADTVQDLLQAREALAKALDPNGSVAKTAAGLLAKEFNAQLAISGCHTPESEHERVIRGIFIKRQAEVQHTFNLLSDAGFMKEASALAASDKDVSAPHLFNAAKREETIKDLITDAPAHTMATAVGQHMLHKALAAVWKIDGPLQPALVEAIHEAAPGMSASDAICVVKDWLHARFHLADLMAKETKVDSGSIYQEAMNRTEASLQKPAAPAPTPPAKHEAPAALTAAPAQHSGMVQAAPAVAYPNAPAL